MVGFHADRLKSRAPTAEYQFYKIMNFDPVYTHAMNDSFWDMVVFGTGVSDSFPKEYLTDRERQIVASVIQWLGTPVGMAFLEKVGFIQRHTVKQEENGKHTSSSSSGTETLQAEELL